MDNWKSDRIASAADGSNPTVIVKMKSGFAVLGDSQMLPGYCILLAYPKVSCLNDLSMEQRADFLLDMSLLGDAILDVCKPIKVNYEILINSTDFLHAHVFPRYEWEPEERRTMPVWLYPEEQRFSLVNQFSEQNHGALKNEIAECLKTLMETNGRMIKE